MQLLWLFPGQPGGDVQMTETLRHYNESPTSRHRKPAGYAGTPDKTSCVEYRQESGIFPIYRGGSLVGRAQRSWSGMTALVADVRCNGDVQADLGAEQTRLSVMLEEIGGQIEIRHDRPDCPSRRPQNDNRGPISLIPAGIEAWGQGRTIRFIRHLTLRLDGPALAELAEEDVDIAQTLTPRLLFFEPRLLRLCELLAEECTSDEPSMNLYGDSLSVALLLALRKLGGETQSRRGGLASWQMRRLADYLEAHLAEDIPLETLASLARLSRSHFCRAFRISTRMSPHQWLLQARIARAKQLLIEGTFPLAELAMVVGFADQAHFTRTFSRTVGVSPRVWQRSRN